MWIREKNIDWLPLIHAPTWDRTLSPGVCPDWGSNWRPFCLQEDTPANGATPARACLAFYIPSVGRFVPTLRVVGLHSFPVLIVWMPCDLNVPRCTRPKADGHVRLRSKNVSRTGVLRPTHISPGGSQSVVPQATRTTWDLVREAGPGSHPNLPTHSVGRGPVALPETLRHVAAPELLQQAVP